MRLVEGIEHLTFLSEDLDRLAGFYERVFEAKKTLDLTEKGFRHLFLEVGPTTVLHPFQILDGPAPPTAPGTMFERGRLDHFGLFARSEEAFREIRRRLEAEGAAARPVRDTGTAWIMDFHDPDGLYGEVIWHKPGARAAEMLRHEDWTTVRLS
jgi:catechol 2,3-dioxygenase-like lactoylglutathione lyase family enzyme